LATRMPKRSRLGEACYPVAGQWIAHGASVDLSARGASSITHKGLTAIVGGGRGCQLRTDASMCAIWIPLRGRVQIGSDGDSLLHVGEARVTETDADVHAVGRGNSLWVVLLGRPSAWRHVMQGQFGIPLMDASLIPARHAIDLDLRRRTVGLARAIASFAPLLAARIGAMLRSSSSVGSSRSARPTTEARR